MGGDKIKIPIKNKHVIEIIVSPTDILIRILNQYLLKSTTLILFNKFRLTIAITKVVTDEIKLIILNIPVLLVTIFIVNITIKIITLTVVDNKKLTKYLSISFSF